MAYKRIGDMLLESGYITQEQLEEALAAQKGSGKRLGELFIDLGFITEKEFIDVLCLQLGIDYIDLSKTVLPPELTRAFPKAMARKYSMVPVRETPDQVYVAMSDPMNLAAQEEARAASRKRIVPMVSTKISIDRAIAQLYGNEGAARAIEDMRTEQAQSNVSAEAEDIRFVGTVLDEDENAQSAPTIRLVNSIIERAALERASDIHLEPRETDMQVRMRIDGIMRNILTVPRDLQASVISRMKIMGGMNIAEHRIPQDGRANVRIKSHEIDLRLSTLPTIFGESAVIRLLDKSAEMLEPEGVGLYGNNLAKYYKLINANNGVLLIAGPTGSGKSSTMYTMVHKRNTDEVKLITLEDPVEYHIDGVSQVQINEKSGMTFSSGLRSILRQDPDIVAVGEIRDGETAEIAMRAAITGHLVFSTIHTYDAPSTIDRLLDVGVEPYLISSGLRGVISQRLVRRICPQCREEYTPDPSYLEALGLTNTAGMHFFHGKGCPNCSHTGYHGRTAVFEILTMNRDLRRAITSGASHEEIEDVLARSDYEPLRVNCMDLLAQGVTTVEEIARCTNAFDD